MSSTPTDTTPVVEQKPAVQRPRPKPLPVWNVVLLNDDDHSYEYVIEMMAVVCHHPPQKGFVIATAVDTQGRAIVFSGHKELAELKRDQILAYGADPRIQRCAGSMTALIEPAA
jgi:ATP-dependent Clp protease adaptor protein ClpS